MSSRPVIKSPAQKRLNQDTRFVIDFEWWKSSNLDLRAHLNRITNQAIPTENVPDRVDTVDPLTGEVRQVDGLQYLLQLQFSRLPDNFLANMPLVDAVFIILLANGNQLMGVQEIADRVHRSPEVVLRTFGGIQIYLGIRPVIGDEE